MARPVIKISFNLPPEDVTVIRELAKKQRATMTGVLRKSIGTQKYLQDAVDKGGKIFVEDRRGRLREIVF